MTGKVKVIGVTPQGKEIGIREVGINRFKEAAFKDGGQVPDALKGNYTDGVMLEKAIKAYLAGLEQKKSASKAKSK